MRLLPGDDRAEVVHEGLGVGRALVILPEKPQSGFVVSVQSKVLPIPFMSLMVLSVVLLWLILLILLLLKS